MSVGGVEAARPRIQVEGEGSNPIPTLQKCHQRIMRERMAIIDAQQSLFGAWWKSIDISIEKAIVRRTNYETARHIIETYEWLGCMAANHHTYYGIYWDQFCGGVVVFGSCVSRDLAASPCGRENADRVIQLQRGACVHWAHPHAASKLISYSLKDIGATTDKRVVIAFSDPMAGEIGTVYQATNWFYCGLTAKRPDYYWRGGERITSHGGSIDERMERRVRPRKHRYCAFVGPKEDIQRYRAALIWPVLPYPKRNPQKN